MTTNEEWIGKARAMYEREGECEIVDDAVVHEHVETGYGAYVQAWLWVPRDEHDPKASRMPGQPPDNC